jgi:ABC-type glycerol-3-phosphate transport system substrate-binding protein
VPGPDLVVKPPSGKAPVTLRFHMRTGGEKSEPAIYVYRPQEWEKQTGGTIKLEPIPGDANYIPKIQALAAGGTIGDLTWASDGHNEYRQLARYNVLEPLNSYLDANKVATSEWVKGAIDSLTMNGKVYSLPKAGYPAYSWVWVNLKMFKDAGIPAPPPHGVTFDNLRDWANKLSTGPKDSRDVYGLFLDTSGNQPITEVVRQFGADLVSADGTTSTVDQPGFADWLKWSQQLIVQDKVHPLASALPSGGLVSMFAAEKVGMAQADRSFQFQAKNAIKDKFEFSVVSFPRGPKALPWAAVCSGHGMCSASKYKDEAFSFLYSIADKRFAYLVGKFQGYLVGRVDELEDMGPYASDPFVKLEYENELQSSPFWVAKNLRSFEFETTLTNALDQIWLGKQQPDASFIGDLKKSLDEVLAKPM